MSRQDFRDHLDARIDDAGRRGLTGTTPASAYSPPVDGEAITVAPDFRPRDQQPAWRQDFPIDWPEDHYVERRDFFKFMVLTSAAFVAGQVWILAQNIRQRLGAAAPGARIASLDDLPVGGALAFHYPTENDPCLLVRVSDLELVAFGQKCTHLSCAVIPRPGENSFYCPCHEGRFDLRTGAPVAGPPRRPLSRVRLEVRGRDVYATGVEGGGA
jgi:nitrite reductase/ring-hydroxylating ferredoxin subunit